MAATNAARVTIAVPAPPTPSARPMATARVKAMPPVGNGKTARPATNEAHVTTVRTRAAIRAKVIPAKVTSATIAAMTAAPPSAAPPAVTTSAQHRANRPHGATMADPTAVTSVGMTAAPWVLAIARATLTHALTRVRLSPHAPKRPLPPPRLITTAACACPS